MMFAKSDQEKTTWQVLIEEALRDNENETSTLADLNIIWAKRPGHAYSDEEMLFRPFHAGWGQPEGIPFRAYSNRYIYFPVCYDGRETVGSIARHPGNPDRPIHYGGY